MPDQTVDWTKKHIFRLSGYHRADDDLPPTEELRKASEPWLAALLQAEHVNLLLGSGFTIAVAAACRKYGTGMGPVALTGPLANGLNAAAKAAALALGRDPPNIEDQIRVLRHAIDGLAVLEQAGDIDEGGITLNGVGLARAGLEAQLNQVMLDFMRSILDTERQVRSALSANDETATSALRLLGSFLLTFSSRAASRERLNIFTTNYDRLIEFGADILGLRLLDRFVGTLEPVFRSSRLGVDLHYNPPGIRGEPRYLEGVVRVSKLHGSIDWRFEPGAHAVGEVRRSGVPFGAAKEHPGLPEKPADSLMIYPNPAKDIETLEFPYADLFRDFAAANCQPNAVLVTYGYGFGDDHINRIIRDMLTIPSTHLVIISWDLAAGRIPRFCDEAGHPDQISLMIGQHAGALPTLVEHYLPKPAIDRNTWKMMELLARRHDPRPRGGADVGGDGGAPPSAGDTEPGGARPPRGSGSP